MSLQRLVLLLHWVLYLGFFCWWGATMAALIGGRGFGLLLERAFSSQEPSWLLLAWGLPIFLLIDWVTRGETTFFPWKRCSSKQED